MIGRGEHEYAAVVIANVVQFRKQLIDDIAARGLAHETALSAERVNFVEEQDTRCRTARGIEDFVQIALALTQPHVEHVSEPDRDEARAHLAGSGARDESLAAAGRAIKHEPAAQS